MHQASPFRSPTRSAVTVLALLIVALGAGSVAAAPPVRVSDHVDVTVQSGFWTAACDVPVFIRTQSAQTFTFFSDRSGQVVAEIDTAPGLKTTVSSPIEAGGTGKSFTYTAATPVRIVYPEGGHVGAPAIVYAPGLGGFYAPGVATAGRTVLEGVVLLVVDGIPIVDVVGLLSDSGRPLDFDEIIAARCGFLTTP